MKEDISAYAFDFECEVLDLQKSLGSRARKIIFIEVDREGSPRKTVVKHAIGGEGISDDLLWDESDDAIDMFSEASMESSYCVGFEGYSDVFVNNRALDLNSLGKENRQLSLLHTLYHETGHALISDGHSVDKDHPYQEGAADAYAALRLIQRFGQEAVPYLSLLSWQRSFSALQGQTSHFTSLIIDKIIADSATQDFSKLRPGETIDLAAAYAKKWTPKVQALAAAREMFLYTAKKQKNLTGLLTSTCLSASGDNLAFYIGAKAAQPFLQPGGVVYNGKPLRLEDKKRQKVAAKIEARASIMSLQNIFNKAAKPGKTPLVKETLKVTLPKGQKSFVCKQ